MCIFSSLEIRKIVFDFQAKFMIDFMEKEINPKEIIKSSNNQPKSKFTLFIAWLILGLAILYGVSPIDLIPDAFLGVGWLDDVGVLGLALYNLFKKIKESRST